MELGPGEPEPTEKGGDSHFSFNSGECFERRPRRILTLVFHVEQLGRFCPQSFKQQGKGLDINHGLSLRRTVWVSVLTSQRTGHLWLGC